MIKDNKIKARYNRYSYFYDLFDSLIENSLFKKWRQELVGSLRGNILEIGVGTGKNLSYYSKEAKVTGIDFSPKMLARAQKKLARLNNHNITLREMDVQSLDFPNNTFDYVVSSFVWCSVPDPIKGLREAKRVLKPDGQGFFLEHVLSKNRLIALWQFIHNPLTRFIFGFNINRDTSANFIQAEFKITEDKKLALVDVFRFFKVS